MLRLAQSLLSIAVLSAAWYLSTRSTEDVNRMFASRASDLPAITIMTRTVMTHPYRDLLLWGIAVVLCGVICTWPYLLSPRKR